MAKLSIVTPWHNAPELIPSFERGNAGAELIIVDNASESTTASLLSKLAAQTGGTYIRNETNRLFAAANNQGLAAASGDVVLFLNNDTDCQPGWIDHVLNDVRPGALYGPSKRIQIINGRNLPYIEGYCIAATADTWHELNGWDDQYYQGLYWEDNDLCWRALEAGMRLIETNWSVWHYGNYTSVKTKGSYNHSQENREAFARRVAAAELGKRRLPA